MRISTSSHFVFNFLFFNYLFCLLLHYWVSCNLNPMSCKLGPSGHHPQGEGRGQLEGEQWELRFRGLEISGRGGGVEGFRVLGLKKKVSS